ncbi:MAG TPA: TfoX/Sxy family protein [Cyclobacteriaceae bacterium]|nr:TfoX/Sxy family protein [Cyclobacteriaceae bacterium]
MAYNEKLADRIRDRLSKVSRVEEKPMMGGLTFMVNGKMCVGIIKDDLMCRIDKTFHEQAVEKRGCRTMDFTNRPMIGYVLIDETGMTSDKDFDYWMSLSLEFNKFAKASKKKKVAVPTKKRTLKKKSRGKGK